MAYRIINENYYMLFPVLEGGGGGRQIWKAGSGWSFCGIQNGGDAETQHHQNSRKSILEMYKTKLHFTKIHASPLRLLIFCYAVLLC